MSGKLDLIGLMKEALVEGEEFDRRLEAAGWTKTRDIRVRAYIELFASGMSEGSQFLVRGGTLFRGGELLHRQHPMAIVITAWGDVWLPPSPEVADPLWQEITQLALEQPDRFRAAVQSIQEADLAFDTCPP